VIERNLTKVWGQLRGAKSQHPAFLEDVRIRQLRGITDLRVPFSYPVSVLAGPNACGKSTVLFSLACAYKVPGAGVKDYVPSTMFPRFTSKDIQQQDVTLETALEFNYLVGGDRVFMRWARSKRGWGRSFGGAKRAQQPERVLYLRTLANLSNPSEVRSYLQMGRQKLTITDVDASLLSFAHRILPFEYEQMSIIAHGKKELFFVRRAAPTTLAQPYLLTSMEPLGPYYSEFHMSAGERSVLRLSANLSKLQGAIVLIDEVETGLHPYIQQQLMFELQQLALRNQLQIIVTTHSPVVIESVPEEGRIFLERPPDADNVHTKAPYRDIIQRAMYGVSRDKLSILCEDAVAEGLALGIFDHLCPKLQIVPSDIIIGRDTGKSEFPTYLKALARFDLLESFVFLLDGDARDIEPALLLAARELKKVPPHVIFLPGRGAPEIWIWKCIEDHIDDYATDFSVPVDELRAQVTRLTKLYDATNDKEEVKAKERFYSFCSQFLNREEGEVARSVGLMEATRGDLNAVTQELQSAVSDWRNQKG
jgi:predicted ATPase/DNA-binding Xre family transcriptional regulator